MINSTKLFDRVVLSCDTSHFQDFIPLVTMAWKKLFNVPVTVIVVDKNIAFKSLLKNAPKIITKEDETFYIKPEPDVPIANQAKLARHWMAGCYPRQKILINDVDFCPLSPWYWNERIPLDLEDKINIITSDGHYTEPGEVGKFPIGDLCAKSDTFLEIVNPHQFAYEGWIEELLEAELEGKEDIMNENFSDESLWRWLLQQWGHPEREIRIPGLLFPFSPWIIDRAWWPDHGPFSIIDLQKGNYYGMHMPRPYKNYQIHINIVAKIAGVL